MAAFGEGEDPDRASVIRLRPGVVEWREIDGEIVGLEIESSNYIASNRSGAVLWQRLSSGTTETELIHELSARWKVDESQARADVSEFLAALTARGLIERTWVSPPE